MASVISEHTQYLDSAGRPLTGGSVYIGDVDADPVANPKSIFSDRELTVAVANPQTLDANGRTTNKIWADGKYSIQVDDINDVQVFQDLDCGDASGVLGPTGLNSVIGTNTITAAGTPTLTAYIDQEIYMFGVAGTNTGATTLNIDGLGAKAVVANEQSALVGGELVAGINHALIYNAANDNFTMMKADLADIYTKSEVYTKAEVDAQSLGSKDWDTGGQVTVADNTAIQNTTGGPIGVMLEVVGDSAVSFEIKVGTSTGTVVAGGYTENLGVPVPTFFLVPDQDYWRVNETVGTINLARAVIFQ